MRISSVNKCEGSKWNNVLAWRSTIRIVYLDHCSSTHSSIQVARSIFLTA